MRRRGKTLGLFSPWASRRKSYGRSVEGVPDLFEPYRYKEWDSPEEWEGWYGEVALALRSVLNAAAELRAIGGRT